MLLQLQPWLHPTRLLRGLLPERWHLLHATWLAHWLWWVRQRHCQAHRPRSWQLKLAKWRLTLALHEQRYVCVWFPCASLHVNHAYSTVILFGLCSQLATVNLQWGDVATDVAALGSTAAAASTSASTTLGSAALPQPAAVVNVTTSDYASVFRLRTVPTSMQVSVTTGLHTNTTATAP